MATLNKELEEYIDNAVATNSTDALKEYILGLIQTGADQTKDMQLLKVSLIPVVEQNARLLDQNAQLTDSINKKNEELHDFYKSGAMRSADALEGILEVITLIRNFQ